MKLRLNRLSICWIMGELFVNFEAYDVQATRKEQQEKDIEKLVKILKKLNVSKETICLQLAEEYKLSEEDAVKKVELLW